MRKKGTQLVQQRAREAYEEPLLIRHEPLLDITGQKSGEKAAPANKEAGVQGGFVGGNPGESTD